MKKPVCPECRSSRVWKDGIRQTRYGEIQRYVCRSCGYRFSERKVKNLNQRLAYGGNRRVCVALAEGTKNLVEVSREQKRAAGATKKKIEVKEKLFEYAWWMKKTGILRRDHKM